MGPGPTQVTDRRHIYKGDFEVHGLRFSASLCHRRLFSGFTNNALDEPAHIEHLFVAHAGAGRDRQLAILAVDGSTEDVPLTAEDLVGVLLNHGDCVGVDLRAELGQIHNPILHATPVGLGAIGAGHHLFGNLDVLGAPVPDGAGEYGVADKGAHIGVVADGDGAPVGSGLLGLGGVLVLGDDIHPLVEKGFGGFLLFRGTEPGVGPDDVDRGFGIGGTDAEGEGVDAADDLRDGEGGNVADLVGLGRHAGHQAGQEAGLVHAAKDGADVGGRLVAGDVNEPGFGVLLSDGDGGVHEAKAGGDDQVVVLFGKVADDAFGIRPFGHVLDVGSFDAHLLQHEPALVVGPGPTQVTNRRHIHKGNFEAFLGGSGRLWSFCCLSCFRRLGCLCRLLRRATGSQQERADQENNGEPAELSRQHVYSSLE